MKPNHAVALTRGLLRDRRGNPGGWAKEMEMSNEIVNGAAYPVTNADVAEACGICGELNYGPCDNC